MAAIVWVVTKQAFSEDGPWPGLGRLARQAAFTFSEELLTMDQLRQLARAEQNKLQWENIQNNYSQLGRQEQ